MKLKQSMTMAGAILLLFLILGAMQTAQAQFVHPGGLHTQADFDRMKAKVAANASPWVDSYNQLAAVYLAQTNWGWAPVGQIIRGITGSDNYARSQKDALAIYYNVLRYRITGDANFANHAIQGMDAWSGTMTNGVGGNSNWALGAGICGYEFAVAGEALRGYPGWSQTSISNYCNFLRLFAGGNDSFFVNHNGTCDSHYRCNWDACNLASLIACGVFCDDTNMFNEAVNYYKSGIGNGSITRAAWYIHNDGTAQWEESGRDQAHTMDGVAWLGVACQVAWNQGVDLFGFDNNRFLRGMEYVAKYNLGNDVPYVFYENCDAIAIEPAISGRGGFPPFWDLFYNHYVNRRGLAAPFTAQAAAMLRPDGFYNNANSPDFVGFTTLTCLLDPISAGAVPGGLTANVIAHSVNLTWWGSAYATSYNVKRATVSGGPYTTIASVGPNSTYYLDGGLASATTNYYVVSAITPTGETANSPEVAGTTANLVGPYYKFNETGGTVASDSSGFGLDGTLINGATWVAGHFGNAVNLNSASQYVALPSGVIGGLGDFTIASWVNLSTVAAWNRIFDFGVHTERYMFLSPEAGAAGPVRFAISHTGSRNEQQISGPATLGTGGWHHVAVTLTGNEGNGVGTLYVDGTPVGTNSAMSFTPGMIGDLIDNTNNFIGRSQFADPYLNGSVDDFRIYNGALSAAGISAIMAGNPPPAPPGPPAAPAAPTGLSATAASSSQINLSWTASAAATSYNVKRATVNGGPYVIIGNLITNLNTTSFSDIGLTDGTTYYYVVSALNDGGQSANSSQASATPPVPVLADYWKFDETSGTTAADSAGANPGTLATGATWAAGKINNAVSLSGTGGYVSLPTGFLSTLNDYTIAGWVNLNSVSAWARIFDFGTGTTNYMFLVPSSGSAIRFAINIGGGEQQISGSSILSTGVWHHFAVTLSGTVGTLYVDGVKAGANGGMTLSPSSLGSTTLNYIGKSQFADPYLNGKVDDFRIYNGALSAAEVFTLVYPPPAAPTALSATGGNSVVNLAWVQSTGPGITQNKVYRSTSGSGGPYNLLATLAATTSYSDTAVVNGSTYFYSVSAVNTNGESALSAYAGAVPQPPPPAAPTGLTAAAASSSQINLSWTASTGATSYNVKRATVSGGPYTTVATGVTGTTYNNTGLTASTTYYYVVSAVNGGGEGANSTQASATTVPAAPTGLTATAGNAQTALSWTASAGALGYNVKRATTSGGPYTTLTNVATTSYTDTTAVNGTTYYYVVSAVNGGGESVNSTQASATPIPTLLAYLKFNETNGTTAADSTGNGWNGTLVNSPTWVTGYSNGAVSLNGTNQYVSLPAGVVSSVSNFTMAAWVKPTTVSTWNRVLDFGNNTTTYMFLTPKSGSGTVRFAITTSGTAGEQQINGTAALSAGAWSHVVVTLSGSVGILYVNGTAVGTNSTMTLSPSSMGSTVNNYIGKSQFNDPYLKGLVDEVRIYKGAMSAGQVSALP